MVNATNTFTVLKSISTSVFFIALIVILIILGIKFVKRNKTSNIIGFKAQLSQKKRQ